jgi:aspartate/methionine/tyrosine aminotransferase
MDLRTIGCEAWLNEYERGVAYDIAQSTIDAMDLRDILALAPDGGERFRATLDSERMNYGWIEGSPDFKRAVATLYQSDVADKNILQTNGATGANLAALFALVGPGDHVVAEYPTYQPLYDIPRSFGAKVDYWHLVQENGWQPDIEELERLVTKDTKLICINNAANPTGCVLSKATLESVADIARTVGAYVLSDEVYIPLEGNYVSMLDVYEKAVVTNSVSKTFSCPGARCGWVVAPDEIADKIRVVRDYTMICSGQFGDMLATFVLENRNPLLERNVEIMRRNKAVVQAWMDATPRADWTAPEGVPVSFMTLDLPDGLTDEEFCLDVLKSDGVLLIPGSRFELPCGARLGYCSNLETLEAGLGLIGEVLAKLDK